MAALYASKNADDYGREMRKFRAMMKEGIRAIFAESSQKR